MVKETERKIAKEKTKKEKGNQKKSSFDELLALQKQQKYSENKTSATKK